ncbi:AAA family ATPase [Dactylosporangium vinaceum]|uniref:BTAD domain-containing putative transcriptional regulator n=1 Tax=Dactylosporangium vinaceum TaxID=53362 RepID=A0ABV5M857_9ACTN|nr:BTAD domain-containing putative transcriptional regulator [Dactylosporangium vinaceum]UAB94264.1 AAA family ATPase [Dactylosporangium vinaceum]
MGLRFRILGPLEVESDAGPVDTGTPKQRAVLAMLATQPGRIVSVQRLIDELWADEPPERAIASLQAYVSRLRRALEPGRTARDRSAVLVSRAPGYVLQVPADSVDAARLAAAVEQVTADPHAALTALTAALELWRGDPLPELGESPLARAERGRLVELRLTALERHSEALLSLGRASEVVYRTESALAEAPYRERLWAQLILALYRTGRQADAMSAYARARQGLIDELGIEPGPELQQLAQDVLRQAPHLAGPPSAAPTSAPPVPTSAPPASAVPRRPDIAATPGAPDDEPEALVGRDEQLRTVDRLIAEAAAGHGRLLLVSGSPGIGKTALLREVAARGAGRGLVGTGVGVDGEAPPVFLPWAQILRGIAGGEGAAGAMAEAFAPYGNLPAVLDPTLGDVLPLAAAERIADPEMARSRLLQGIVDGLGRLAGHTPLVLVLDDAHWLDAPSTVLLTLLAKALRGRRVLLAVGYREAELAADAPLAGVLAELVAAPAAVRMPLDGLGLDGIAALARSVTGDALPPETVLMLADRTGGNPFFVVELLKVLAAEHTLAPEHVPVRVQEVVRRRLAKLPGQVNAVLAVAAVLGRDVAVPVLREVVQIDELDLFDTLDTAVVAGLLTATDDPGLLRFSHDLVRQTAYQDQGPMRRARLHARAAQALRDTGLGNAAQLAGHLRAALPVLSPYDVVPGLTAAAREAYDRTAHEQAEALLEEGLELLQRVPAGERRDVAELDLRIRLAYMRQASDGYLAPVAAEQYAAMEPLLMRLRGRPVLDVLPALWGYASFHTAAGDVPRAVAVARSMAHGPGDPWGVVVAEVHEGHAALTELDLPRACAHFENALDALPGGDLPVFPIVNWDPVIGALAPAALVCGLLGEDGTAQEHLRAARDRAGRVGELFLDMYVAHFTAVVAADRDDPVAAAAAARDTLALAERGGYREYQSLAGLVLGWAEARTGDPAGLERMTAARAHLGPAMSRFGRLEALYADALLAVGRPEQAGAVAAAALAAGLPGQSGFAEPDLRRIQALATGEPTDAARERALALHHAHATARAERTLVADGEL